MYYFQKKISASESSIVSPPSLNEEEKAPKTEDVWEGTTDRKKLKRPGLSQTLVPGKKVLKMYKQQKNNDNIKKSNA